MHSQENTRTTSESCLMYVMHNATHHIFNGLKKSTTNNKGCNHYQDCNCISLCESVGIVDRIEKLEKKITIK